MTPPASTRTTRVELRLDPDAPADLTLRAVLDALLDLLAANIDGARDNQDPEYLHDLRVATRRTRVALGQARGLLPEAQRNDFRQRFAWLQQVTGPVRDLDVWLGGFTDLAARLPAPLGADLEPLREALGSHHKHEQVRLEATLGGAELHGLLIDWRAALTHPAPAPGPVPTTRAFADARIRRMLRRLRREGRAIDDASPDADFHELRKTAKKLRYLLEFYQSLYPPALVRGLIDEIKRLLDNLGAIQDLAVQTGHLRGWAARLHGAGAPLSVLLASGALIGVLLARRAGARARFGRLFATFDGDSVRRRFRQMRAAPLSPDTD